MSNTNDFKNILKTSQSIQQPSQSEMTDQLANLVTQHTTPHVVAGSESALKAASAHVTASLWRRAVALIIDEILIGLILYGPAATLLICWTLSVRSAPSQPTPQTLEQLMEQSHSFSAMVGVSTLFVIVYALFSFCLPIMYFAFFESGNSQATPGKQLMGLKVVSTNGQPFGYWMSVWKTMLQLALLLLFVAPAFAVPDASKDMVALIGGLLYFLVGYGIANFNSGRQTLFDKMTGRFVVLRKNASTLPVNSHLPNDSGWTVMQKLAVACSFFAIAMFGVVGWLHVGKNSAEELVGSEKLNNDGAALIAKRALHKGDIVSAADYTRVELGKWRTPLNAVVPSAHIDGAKLTQDVHSGAIIYNNDVAAKETNVQKKPPSKHKRRSR